MSAKVTGILLTSPILERTYKTHEFVGDETNYKYMKSSDFMISRYYKIYASIFFKILSIKYALRSKTFRYRLLRTTGVFDLLLSLSKRDMNWALLLICPLKILALLLISPVALIPRKILSWINSFITVRPLDEDMLAEIELLIFPFTAFEVEQLFLPNLCNKHQIKLVYVADNWDNLSSKTVILDPPTKLFVWGNQAVAHAREIQGFDKDVIELGSSPRLQVYSSVETSQQASKVLGFMGAFMYFDELDAINQICDQLPPDWTLLYRPHPWAMRSQDLTTLELHPKATLDIDENGSLDTSIEGTKYFFEKVTITTGGLTTMMIESLIAGRPCIALNHEDNFLNFYSPRKAYNNYIHFDGINKLQRFRLLDNLEIFRSIFDELNNENKFRTTDDWLRYYVDVKKPATLKTIREVVR